MERTPYALMCCKPFLSDDQIGVLVMIEELLDCSFTNVYHMLEDDESRDIYLARLNFLISGNFKYMYEMISKYLPEMGFGKKKNLDDLLNLLPPDRKFLLYGAGVVGAGFLRFFEGDPRFIGFCSRTVSKQKNGYLGYPVMSPEELLLRKDISVLIATASQKDEILEVLRKGKYPEELIFENLIFKDNPHPVTMDPLQYFNPDFMRLEEREIFVDAGACNLETSLILRERCPDAKVYAFEPDDACYQCCLKKKDETNFSAAKIFPFGTWSKQDVLHFCIDRTGSSRICEDGMGSNCDIPVMTIDEAIDKGDKVTFIKMDVEGSELESLKGARQTILRDKPKLAICIYHKPEDMYTIPLYIKKLVPEYKLYIRHHATTSGETVLYAVMP